MRGHRQHPQGQGGNRYPDTDHRDLQAHLEGQKTYAINLAWTVDGPPLTRNLMTTCPSGAMVYARLGQGRGNQLMVYERAYHRFQAVEVAGQAEAEGRG